VNLPSNATFDQVDSALRAVDAAEASRNSLSLETQGINSQRSSTVIAIMYDIVNYAGNSITHTAASSSGCLIGSYGVPDYTQNPYPGYGNWNDKIESSVDYANCNVTVVYEHTNYAGSLNPCASPCSTMGLLNNNVSSNIIRYSYP
jgi:hypothetical protein